MLPRATWPEIARAICDRHTGVGADGWMLVAPPADAEAEGVHPALQFRWQHGGDFGQRHALRRGLSDPPRPCAAGVVRVRTGAGIKTLRLLEAQRPRASNSR